MPNIPTYTSRVPTPKTSQATISAPLVAGAAWADLAGSVGRSALTIYDKREEQRALEESTNLAAEIATTSADLDVQFEEAKKNADPNAEDFPDFAANWRAKVADPAIDNLGQGLRTKEAQRQAQIAQAKLRGMYYVKTNVAQSEMSGAQAVKNINTLTNSVAASVYKSPETFDIGLGIIDNAVQGLIAAGLPRDQALAIQRTMNEAIAESAFRGAAEVNPDRAQKDWNAGRYAQYLPESKQSELRDYVETQKRAAELEKERAQRDADKAKKDAAEARESDITSRIITEPTKVDPREIARDPTLSGEQKRVLTNFLEDQLKPQSTDPDANKGPGFWNAYQRVMADGPTRITDSAEIYKMAGPGKPLTLQGANALVSLLKERREGNKVGNFDTDRENAFFKEMHRQVAETPFGQPRLGGEEDYFRLHMDKMRQIEEGRAKGKTLEQLLDPRSPDYIGKDVKSYIPPQPARTYTPREEEKPRGWMEFFGQMLGSGPAFSTKELDAKLPDGAEGQQQGLTALKAAIATGQITREQAGAYAVQRGWARPSDGKQAGEVPSGLNDKEKFLYRHHLDSLNGRNGQATLNNPDGSKSTIKAFTVTFDDRAFILPSIWGGKELSEDESIKRAKKEGLDKYPSYPTVEAAEARYQELHRLIEKDEPQKRSGQVPPVMK